MHFIGLGLTVTLLSREGRNSNPPGDPGVDKRLGDLLLSAFDVVTMDNYLRYLEAHAAMLDRLEATVAHDPRFAQVHLESPCY